MKKQATNENSFVEEAGPLGLKQDLKTPYNYFVKLRDTFKDSSRSVDYLMRLKDENGERIGIVYVVVFQFILLETINTNGYLLDILGDRNNPETLKYHPIPLEVLTYRFKGYFEHKEIEEAIRNLMKLDKIRWSAKYKTFYVVDFPKHVGKERDWQTIYKERYKKDEE